MAFAAVLLHLRPASRGSGLPSAQLVIVGSLEVSQVGGSEAFCSLAGLAVGDAFGGGILLAGGNPRGLGRHRPDEQEALAPTFATHYNPDRGYGAGVARLLLQFRDGDSWRRTAATAFGGQGSWGNGAPLPGGPPAPR